MSERNLVTWSTMIDAYCQHEKYEEALDAFSKMRKDGLVPDLVNFASVFKACAGLGDLVRGRAMNELFKRSGAEPNTMLGNSLLNMYVKCGSLKEAKEVFDSMEERDAGSWSIIISGYAKSGNASEAMRLFRGMESTSTEPDEVTYLSILNACAMAGDLEQSIEIHDRIKKSGASVSNFTWNTLIDVYAKCGSLADARDLFAQIPERDAVTWNAMIVGLTKHGHHEDALSFHQRMLLEGIPPDTVSFVSVLNACTASEGCLEHGRRIHSQVAQSAADLVNVFVENALIDMYGKCGCLTTARKVFDEMRQRNVVSWNTLIAGYGRRGLDWEVLLLFERMMAGESVEADEFTYVSLLNACATMAMLEPGMRAHDEIVAGSRELDVFVGNALIDMYAKCGRIMDAAKVLDRMPERSVVSWNTMLAGHAQHGHGHEALCLAHRMQREHVELNHVSFVGLLAACSHAGLVDEGRSCFVRMDSDLHDVPRAVEHYGCMVDLLGRAGLLHEAEKLLDGMPDRVATSVVLWRALLGACRIHGHVELALRVAERVHGMDPDDCGAILLLSSIHTMSECSSQGMCLLGLDDEESMFMVMSKR
jgi:pentatricopeptide repeat protein